MTVTAFRLENFMAFRDTGWIELRSITLLFGRNSSGKSVLIRALRLLKQSFENNAILKINDEYGVELGEESDIYHGDYDKEFFSKDEKAKNQSMLPTLRFGFRVRLDGDFNSQLASLIRAHCQITDHEIDQGSLLEQDEVQLTLGIRWDYREGFYLADFELGCAAGIIFAAERFLDADLIKTIGIWGFETSVLHSYEEEGGERLWANLEIAPSPGTPMLPYLSFDQNKSDYTDEALDECLKLSRIIEGAKASICEFLAGIVYVRPVRPLPELVYSFDLHTQEKWNKLGWAGYYQFLHPPIDTADAELIDHWIQRCELGEKVVVERSFSFLNTGDSIIEVESNGAIRRLSNVGFGVSQLLPVIVESILASENSLVIIEQPELHLHPKAQAEVANMFIDASARNKCRFLVETHSENILYRLRLFIAETNLRSLIEERQMRDTYEYVTGCDVSEKQVAVYFVNRPDGNSTSLAMKININKSGEYLELPKEFKTIFADDTRALMQITDAVFRAETLQSKKR